MYKCRKKKDIKSTIGYQFCTIHPILAMFTVIIDVSTVMNNEAKRKITLQICNCHMRHVQVPKKHAHRHGHRYSDTDTWRCNSKIMGNRHDGEQDKNIKENTYWQIVLVVIRRNIIPASMTTIRNQPYLSTKIKTNTNLAQKWKLVLLLHIKIWSVKKTNCEAQLTFLINFNYENKFFYHYEVTCPCMCLTCLQHARSPNSVSNHES